MLMKLEHFLQIAGLLHFSLLIGGATMPRAVNLKAHLATLPPFIRRLFWVYFSFIAMMLVSFGVLTLWNAPRMALGEPTARSLCIAIAVFWTARLIVAAWVFDVRPYLTRGWYRAGYWAANLVFVYLTAIYVWASFVGISRWAAFAGGGR
jgi:hypothetical protein